VHVQPILKAIGSPSPYTAVLVADGDRVGKAISSLHDERAHRDFSAALLEFARQTRRVVEQEHRGILVYAGGDDVLAFVGLPDVLDCAAKLRELFNKIIEGAFPSVTDGRNIEFVRPTLSVGIGVGHVLESLRFLLELAKDAEKRAKVERNSLGITLQKRAGHRTSWVASWGTDDHAAPVEQIRKDVRALRGALSGAKLHEIERDLRRMPDFDQIPEIDSAAWAEVVGTDVRRTLRRAGGGTADANRVDPESVGLDLGTVGATYKAVRANIDAWISRMFCARIFQECEQFDVDGGDDA